ncbi:MAG: STAS domain-containing protein [Enhygromyxa sp.]
MLTWVESSRSSLEQAILAVLRKNVAENGSGLPPFRLPRVAKQIVASLAQFLENGTPDKALEFGKQMSKQGLGLRSWLAVSRALTDEFTSHAFAAEAAHGPGDPTTVLARLQQFITHAVDGLVASAMTEVTRERDEIQSALERVIQRREDELRQLVEQLSAPVVSVYEQILVLPLIGSVNDERAARITEHLLAETVRLRARIVIIDLTGLSTNEAETVARLVSTVRAVELLGARAVLVGIPAKIVRILTNSDLDLTGLSTLTNLQSGVEWALRELGLAISPTEPKPERSKHHDD